MPMLILLILFALHHVSVISQISATITLTTELSTPTLQQRDIVYFTTIVTVTSQPAQSTASPSYTNSTEFHYDTLNQTNYYRQQHNASALTWNNTLATYAQNWADHCNWKHSGGPYGENLAEGFSNVTSAIDAWANEGVDYDYSQPTGFSEKTGHFTQLVWKATTQVGCAAANCSANDDSFGENTEEAFGWYLVCEYWPPGNVVGDGNQYFKDNVQPAISGAGQLITGSVGMGVWGLVVMGTVLVQAL